MAERFHISFDGPAIEDHTIDAAVLGESLVAVADLLLDARAIIVPDGPRYRVRVEEAGEGSFEIALELKELWEVATSLYQDPTVQAIEFLLAVFGRDGLFGLLLWLKGRQPIFQRTGDGKLRVIADDEEKFVTYQVGDLFFSKNIRKSTRKIAGVISEDRIEEVSIRLPGEEPLDLNPGNRSYLTTPVDEDKVTDEITEMWLRVHTARFESDRWWFRDSITRQLIRATVEDEGWLDRVDRGEIAVRSNDSIHALVRIEQWEDDDEPQTEYTVLEVLETVNEAGRQERFMPPTLDSPEPPTRTDE